MGLRKPHLVHATGSAGTHILCIGHSFPLPFNPPDVRTEAQGQHSDERKSAKHFSNWSDKPHPEFTHLTSLLSQAH
jgi:hypothetical protein